MAIDRQIRDASIDDLYLDPTNPRLGRRNASRKTKQPQVLKLMRDFTLEELAVSFVESKEFWPQEALIAVKEKLYGCERLVVVEGNRRLAALKLLRDAINEDFASRRWKEVAEQANLPAKFFETIPYLLADSRDDVDAFLGFRHVTGIKQWDPAEKAEYIAKLIEKKRMSYVEVMRTIGSKTEPVRRNYISYQILIQLESLEDEDKVSLEHIEEKFSVLFLSLRERGVQRFLDVNIQADPKDARTPVPPDKLDSLADFASWLFGTEKRAPLFTDSRHIGKFAKILESPKAVEYLRTTSEPSFELAGQKAGADEPELIDRVKRATDEIEQTLSRVHLHTDSNELQEAVRRFGLGAMELLKKFPKIYAEVNKTKH
jgi:hypothetical protein